MPRFQLACCDALHILALTGRTSYATVQFEKMAPPKWSLFAKP
jgi:hypothetical protein